MKKLLLAVLLISSSAGASSFSFGFGLPEVLGPRFELSTTPQLGLGLAVGLGGLGLEGRYYLESEAQGPFAGVGVSTIWLLNASNGQQSNNQLGVFGGYRLPFAERLFLEARLGVMANVYSRTSCDSGGALLFCAPSRVTTQEGTEVFAHWGLGFGVRL